MSEPKRMTRARLERMRKSWWGMIYRCTDETVPNYKDYGGRGITVCDRWRNSFDAFLADMGPRPDGMSLDRIDNDGNYEPGNCRWATQKEQQRNRRNNVLVEIDGRTQTIAGWAEESGLTHMQIHRRLRRCKWSGPALLRPVVANPRKTHCPKGHEYTAANKGSDFSCLECRKISGRKRRAAKRAGAAVRTHSATETP